MKEGRMLVVSLQVWLMLALSSVHAYLWADGLRTGGHKMGGSLFTNGSIRPSDPKFVIGRDNITLICSYNVTNSSRLLSFEYKDGTVMDAKYLTVLSPIEVKLQMPALSLNQSGYYTCVYNSSSLVAGMDVRVGSEPEEVEDFSCVSENLESMTCSWCPSEKERSPYVVWDVQWSVGSITGRCSQVDRVSCSCYLCGKLPEKSHPFFEHCQKIRRPQFLRTSLYNFTVVARNMYGNASASFSVDPEKLVKPNPVSDLEFTSVKSNLNSRKSQVDVSWSPPSVSHFTNLKYNVTLKCKWDKNSQEVVVTEEHHLFEDLYPNTKYEVYVRAKPTDSGFWSNESVIEFLSPETVPLGSPRIVNYRRLECHEFTNCFGIIIYWQPIPKKLLGSELQGYEISWMNSNGVREMKKVQGDLWSYQFEDIAFDGSKSHTFNLRCITAKGLSDSHTFTIPPFQEDSALVKLEGVRLENHKLINISAKSGVFEDSSFGLFSCKTPRGSRTLQICEHGVHELHFNGSRLHFQVNDPGDDYMFAVAEYSPSENTSLGLQPSWLCIWDQCGDVRKPKVSLSKNKMIERILVLELEEPECFENGGKIHLLKITVDGPGYKNSTTLKPFKELVIPGLEPFASYKVVLEASGDPECSMLMKSEVASYNFWTPESAPSSPPTNVQVVLEGKYNQTAIITWDPSPSPNGQIRQSYVLLQSNGQNYSHATSETGRLKVPDLPGYRNYSVTVRVTNGAGVSPWSEATVIHVPMRAPSDIDLDSINAVYNQKNKLLNVTWSYPEMANGPLSMFHVNVRAEKTKRSIYVKDEAWTTLEVPDVCLSNSKVNVSVEAENCEAGKCFKSSVARKTLSPCQVVGSTRTSYGPIIGLVVAVALFLIFLCIGWICCKRKKLKWILGEGKEDSKCPWSDTESHITENKIDMFFARAEPPKPGMEGHDHYEELRHPEEANTLLFNTESSHYGQVTQNGHLPNGSLPKLGGDAFTSKDGEKRQDSGFKNDDDTPESTEPLLESPNALEPGYQKPIALGYEDCLFLPSDSYGGDKLSSESSDITSPSSTEESTECTPLESTEESPGESPRDSLGKSPRESPDLGGLPEDSLKDSKAPTVKLPKGEKVPTVALPNNLCRSKSQHSVSSDASDTGSLASFTVPTVQKPISIQNTSSAKKPWRDSGDSGGSSGSIDCETGVPSVTIPSVTIPSVTIPSVTIPNGYAGDQHV